MIRLFVNDALKAGTALEPSPEQARYLTGVMRKGPGDELLLFNGRDGEWRARIADVSKRGCRLTLVKRTRPQAFGPDLELVVALVKRARLETIVEKAAELGALRVQLVTTRYTNAERTNVDRLHLIAAEAAEQAGRLDVPQVRAPVALDWLLDGWPGDRALVFCDESGEARPMIEALAGGASAASILIGPEGGFAPEERARLRELPFVTPVSLGPRILRADTAAISAMTLWQAATGDWRERLPHPI